MKNEKYDVIVIGAGVGGPTAGAILAKKEGMKVLVLERSARIGGRDISFDLKKETVNSYRNLLGDSAYTWFVKSEPDISELFNKGYLDGFTVEAGIHTLMVTEKGRTNTCLSYLGKPLTLYPAVSAGWWHGGELSHFEQGSEKGGQFPLDEQRRSELNAEESIA